MMILLVCFGAIVATGPLLTEVNWQIVVVALLVLFVVRPALAWLSLTGAGCPGGERAIISVFGIRGLGSVYYLAYASGKAEFEGIRTIWATVLLIILISIVVHGVAVTPTMSWLDGRRPKKEDGPATVAQAVTTSS